MHASTRTPSKLFVTPAMASHPTLAGERIDGTDQLIYRRRRRHRSTPWQALPLPMAKMPEPPGKKRELSPGAWLFACAAPAIVAVICAGLLA